MAVTFCDVAACFSEEEWKLLHEKQKLYYRNVMKDIHQALIAMGYQILNPEVLLRIINWEGVYHEDPNSPKGEEDASPHRPSISPSPDILLRIIKHEDDWSSGEMNNSDDTEIGIVEDEDFIPNKRIDRYSSNQPILEDSESMEDSGLATDHRIASSPTSDMFTPVKPEGEQSCRELRKRDETKICDDLSTSPTRTSDLCIRIKQEDELSYKDLHSSDETEFSDGLSTEEEWQRDSTPNHSNSRKKKEEATDAPPAKRNCSLDDKDAATLEGEKNEMHTRMSTKWATDIFRSWLKENDHSTEFETLSPAELNELLKHFYAEVRNSKGKEYQVQSLVSIRAGINRHLSNPPFSRGMNLMHHTEFSDANSVFTRIVKQLRGQGQFLNEHKKYITDSDLKKLKTSGIFSVLHPMTLQYKVWFDIQLHLAHRGREGLRRLTPQSFVFRKDQNGQEYATLSFNEPARKHSKTADQENLRGRMYENPADPNCPVKSLKMYLRKLPPNATVFYLQAKKITSESAQREDIWYTPKPVGKNTLGNFMKTISQKANLSTVYTNHCLRITAVQLLANAGLHTREIIAVTGHKCESSVQSYWQASNNRANYSGILNAAGQVFVALPTVPQPLSM